MLQNFVNEVVKIRLPFVCLQVEGQVHLIWAYGVNDVTDQSTFNRHSVRGWSDKLVIVGEAPVPTKAAASCLHSRINAIAAFAIVLLSVLAM